jgi:hypothetical protein
MIGVLMPNDSVNLVFTLSSPHTKSKPQHKQLALVMSIYRISGVAEHGLYSPIRLKYVD